jgi:hypothetical protein
MTLLSLYFGFHMDCMTSLDLNLLVAGIDLGLFILDLDDYTVYVCRFLFRILR